MAQRLGICVSTKNSFKHVAGIARSAKNDGIEVEIFFTGEGVHQSQHADFTKLLDYGKVAICEVSYITNGYKGRGIPGLGDKDFVTQARNAEMVDECDRYIIL
ncbi:MAG: DsrE family protein [Deltaproteobacteria bacterium]|nr:DsrE family protein [Deltaproteobacteria bacterium]MBW1958733.1 DsrE family protein [Deltaproteobacteria bacterium]